MKIILKVTKNQGFNNSLEDPIFEKPKWGIKLNPNLFGVKQTTSLTLFEPMSTLQ